MREHGEDLLAMILGRRTIRSFAPKPIPVGVLERMVDAGRLAPSAANMQPLEFVLVDDPAAVGAVFPHLKWAAYIAPAGDPQPGREPAAYVVVLVNTGIREKFFEYDVGAAVENMTLAGLTFGVGSCWLMNIDREKLAAVLGIPEGYRLDCVLALGYPAEEPAAEDMKDSVKYWKDGSGRLHVPKRTAASVVHRNGF